MILEIEIIRTEKEEYGCIGNACMNTKKRYKRIIRINSQELGIVYLCEQCLTKAIQTTQ